GRETPPAEYSDKSLALSRGSAVVLTAPSPIRAAGPPPGACVGKAGSIVPRRRCLGYPDGRFGPEAACGGLPLGGNPRVEVVRCRPSRVPGRTTARLQTAELALRNEGWCDSVPCQSFPFSRARCSLAALMDFSASVRAIAEFAASG